MTRTGRASQGITKSSFRPWLSATTILASVCAMPALAQDKPAVEAASTADATPAVADIIVTAQKRAQKLQDVPISIAVVSGETIAAQNFRSLGDLSRNQPAFSVAPVGRGVRLSLRGISSGTNTAFDQSVVTFIDDVYHGKARASGSLLLDVDRIELLKGPQTTFFGNNAIAGAINVQSVRPKDEFGGSMRALYGDQGEYAAEAIVNVPVSDTLAIRVAGLANGMNGYILDRSGGTKAPHERNYAGRVSALWTPSDAFTLFVKAETTDNRMRGGIGSQLVDCPPRPPFTTPGRFCPDAIAAGADTKLNYVRDMSPGQALNLKTQDYLADAPLDLGSATLTSVTGFSHFTFLNNQDADGGPAVLFGLSAPQKFNQFSQELRLASDDANAPLSYIVGGYYQTSKFRDISEFHYLFLSPAINAAAPFAGLRASLPFGQVIDVSQKEETLSGFASLTWRPLEELSVTASGRVSRVKKNFSQLIFYGQANPTGYGTIVPYTGATATLANIFGVGGGLGAAGVRALSRSDSKFTPSFNIQYKADANTNFYASYSEGFKAGGFNGTLATGTAADLPFSPEFVTAYEAGFRSELLDRRLLLNGTYFHSKYRDLQVSIFAAIAGTPVSIVQNAASSVSQGIEMEAKFAVSRSLTLGTALNFLDSHFENFPNASPTAAQRALRGQTSQNLSGAPTAYAPRFASTFYANFKAPITNTLNIAFDATLLHQSGYYTADQIDPNLFQDTYNKIDLRAALSSADDAWEFSVIGKNITNRMIKASGIDSAAFGTYFITLERPRSVVAQIRYKW